MTQVQESRPGREAKAAINLGDDTTLAPASDIQMHPAAGLVSGVYVAVVETPGGRYRRRVYFNLPSAQRAVDRATMAGHEAHVVLCRLVPVSGDPLV